MTKDKNTKMEKNRLNTKKGKAETNQFVQMVLAALKGNQPLVYNINNIYTSNKPRMHAWRNLSKAEKLFLVSILIVDNTWEAVTTRFSIEFIKRSLLQNCRESINTYISRRMRANLKNMLGYYPMFAFVLEYDNPNIFHLHGIIKVDDRYDEIRKAILITAFGRKYRDNEIPASIKIKFKRIYDKIGWCNYMQKDEQDIYIHQELLQEIQRLYENLRNSQRKRRKADA